MAEATAPPASDYIDMRLHDLTPFTYDRRADYLAAVGLDDEASPKLAARLMREAQKLYKRTCQCASSVLAALRSPGDPAPALLAFADDLGCLFANLYMKELLDEGN